MTKMTEASAQSKQLWFLRVEGVQLGPYSSGRVRSLLVSGELQLNAEISRDREHWDKIHRVAEVVPLRLRAQLGDRSAQSLMHARRVADQRSGTDDAKRFPIAATVVMSLLVLGSIALSIWHGLPQHKDLPDCKAQAAPGIDWSHCVLTGIDVGAASLAGANLDSADLRQAKLTATNLTAANLRYGDLSRADLSYASLNRALLLGANLQGADLSDADLSQADLRFADLTGSRLDRANLQGARLDKAIWSDGRPCISGSVGRCLH